MQLKTNYIRFWMMLYLKMPLEKELEMSLKNYSRLLRIVPNLLKNETSKKLSMRSKRIVAVWNNDYLLKILNLKG